MSSTGKKLSTRQLGRNGPFVSTIGLGTMSIGAYYGETDMEEAYKALTLSADSGMTFWDTADVYGTGEEFLGKWFTETGRRSEIFLCTKFGGPDLSDTLHNSKPSYIRSALKSSLAKLQCGYIDLYYQHRVDPDIPIEVVIKTLGEFVENQQIKHIGLIECSIETLKRAKAVPKYGDLIIAVQSEFSPFTLDLEKSGFAAAAREMGVGIVAYSPFSRGLGAGGFRTLADLKPGDLRVYLPRFSEDNFSKNVQLAEHFKNIGTKYGATAAQVILAWILAEYPHCPIIPIPGSRSRSRVEDNVAAAQLKLSSDDVKELKKVIYALDVQGDRYPDFMKGDMNGNSIPLEQWEGE